jgi:hypothetical protein
MSCIMVTRYFCSCCLAKNRFLGLWRQLIELVHCHFLAFHGVTVLPEPLYLYYTSEMELFIALGRDPNKTFKGSFSVRIGRELHVKAYKATLKKEITLNQLVSKALEHEVEQTS